MTDNEREQGSVTPVGRPLSWPGIFIGAGLAGVLVGVIMWYAESQERRSNYTVTIVVLVVSAFVILLGVILLSGRGPSAPVQVDRRPLVERMNERMQRD